MRIAFLAAFFACLGQWVVCRCFYLVSFSLDIARVFFMISLVRFRCFTCLGVHLAVFFPPPVAGAPRNSRVRSVRKSAKCFTGAFLHCQLKRFGNAFVIPLEDWQSRYIGAFFSVVPMVRNGSPRFWGTSGNLAAGRYKIAAGSYRCTHTPQPYVSR